MKKVTGIWLDLDKACIYHLQKGKNDFQIVNSQIEHYHLVGGSGSSTPYGPQETVSEKKFLERKKQQKRDYFRRIALYLRESKDVVLIGPAEIKFDLADYLDKTHGRPYNLHKPVTQDSMTENQVKATIRDFYRQKK